MSLTKSGGSGDIPLIVGSMPVALKSPLEGTYLKVWVVSSDHPRERVEHSGATSSPDLGNTPDSLEL